jgi:Protein of unknown function (DUF3306)
MSEPTTFIARWSRLKRQSGEAAPPDEIAPDGSEVSPAPAVDLASLPPIESIMEGGDVRPFLQPGVPADVTREALRHAWVADPAIRDFIGIAENQWDFNDPAGIPGFGPLGADDAARARVGRAVANLGAAAVAIVGAAGLAASAVAAAPDPPRKEHVDKVWLSSAKLASPHPDPPQAASRPDGDPASIPRRSHGAALPK